MSAPSWRRSLPFFRGEPIPDTLFLTEKFTAVHGKRAISTGAYAVVQISQSIADPSNVVAIKTLRYSEDEESNAEMDRILLKEITPLLLAYKHPNILEFKGLIQDPLGIVTAFIENGSLGYYLQKNPNADRPKILRDVAQGLNYLHTPRAIKGLGRHFVVAHGDLHPGNVLIKRDGTAVLSDFGLCKFVEWDALTSSSMRYEGRPAGVAAYVAPEMRSAKPPPNSGDQYTGRRTLMSDVFAFGMLIFTTLGGNPKTSLGPDSATIASNLINRQRPLREHITAQLDEEYWTIATECWAHVASDRPPIARVCARLGALRKPVTTAQGLLTHGALNTRSSEWTSFSVGASDDKGVRPIMEDACSFVVDFDRVRGQGFFAVFCGHGGQQAAEWCGQHFHDEFLETLAAHRTTPIPDVLNKTFHIVDYHLSKIAPEGNTQSGCSTVIALLRFEDAQGGQSFLAYEGGPAEPSATTSSSPVRNLVSSIRHSKSASTSGAERAVSPPPGGELRRVLYTANAGDARAVLCRAGKAVRLTYDHKGSDRQEAKRIMDAGGFVMNNRVNGVLAVTRALGDSSMKEFVVGAPYTTETELSDEDEFLIIACYGLWDVAEDQEAVDLVRSVHDAQEASAKLLKHAMANFSTDNVTVLVVRLDVGKERR